ncbi:MAG: zinc ABC transporter substrate-binding protein [Candidatus Eisenbacteria bacterium]|nr:zinc ABC transporter substrate-binding protein [Candidatus Eisenbacteria bacterium]
MRTFIFTALTALCLAAAALPAGAELQIAATTSDLAWIAERVGGDDAEVMLLCPGERDPHNLPAKPSLARKLGRADLLVYNGLELEVGWLPLLIDAARNPDIRPGSRGELDCSQALETILEVPEAPVDRSRGDIHPLGNPHYLADPRNGVGVARLMAERMATLDPPAADRYSERAESLALEIARRLSEWETAVAPLRSHAIVVYTKQWEYLLHWLDLELLGAIEHRPGIAPSPRHVEELVRAGRRRGDAIVIAAPWNHLDAARQAAERMQAPFVLLPAAVGSLEGAADYLRMFDTICAALAGAAGSDGD